MNVIRRYLEHWVHRFSWHGVSLEWNFFQNNVLNLNNFPVMFSLGRLYYRPEKLAEESILIKFYGCIKHALGKKWRRKADEKKPAYWLHYAVGRYEESFVSDVAKVLKV